MHCKKKPVALILIVIALLCVNATGSAGDNFFYSGRGLISEYKELLKGTCLINIESGMLIDHHCTAGTTANGRIAAKYDTISVIKKGYIKDKSVVSSEAQNNLNRAQWTTSPRLLRLKEAINFYFIKHRESTSGELRIYPQYLEQYQPGPGFAVDGDLSWLDSLPSEHLPLVFTNGKATITYTPGLTGNYIARWCTGNDTLYRYFSVVEDDYVVLCFSPFMSLEVTPSLHSVGIPVDHRLPVQGTSDSFDTENPDACFKKGNAILDKFISYQYKYGETIIPFLPDKIITADIGSISQKEFPLDSSRSRSEIYRQMLDKSCTFLPDPDNRRAARLSAGYAVDPGFSKSLIKAGVNDHSGMWEANAKPWLGMPEFPYFSSVLDCRKPSQTSGGTLIAHQWDFCGSWRFLGPVSWHFGASMGDWTKTSRYLLEGIHEFSLASGMSGHPVFVYPLYDGVTKEYTRYYAPDLGWNARPMFSFVESYIRFMAFEAPKTYKLVYTRALDIADYYMRHFDKTPRTVFSSRTDDFLYDWGWTFQNPKMSGWPAPEMEFMKTKSILDWNTNVKQIFDYRASGKTYFKDPLSHEFILVEDQHRQMRFERESAQPLWWFEYTDQGSDLTSEGSIIHDFSIPLISSIKRNGWNPEPDETLRMTLTMNTQDSFTNYAIALWGLPPAFIANPDPERISTNANKFILVKNRIGEYHLVLIFDLVPNGEIDVVIHSRDD